MNSYAGILVLYGSLLMRGAIQHGAKHQIGTIDTEDMKGEKTHLVTRIFLLAEPFLFFLNIYESMQALPYSHVTGFGMWY